DHRGGPLSEQRVSARQLRGPPGVAEPVQAAVPGHARSGLSARALLHHASALAPAVHPGAGGRHEDSQGRPRNGQRAVDREHHFGQPTSVNMFRRNLIWLIAILALALPFASGAEKAGPKAPDFSLRTLDGKRVKLSDYEGKVVLLSFWATWCAPCKQELPILQRLLDKYEKDGLAVLAVNIDDPKTVAEVRRFVADRKLKMPVPLDGDSKVLGRFNPRHSLPFLQAVDREGRRAFQHTGFTSGTEKALEEQILALLRPAAAAATET